MITVISFSLRNAQSNPTFMNSTCVQSPLSEATHIHLQILHFIVKVMSHCHHVCVAFECEMIFTPKLKEGQIYLEDFKGTGDI